MSQQGNSLYSEIIRIARESWLSKIRAESLIVANEQESDLDAGRIVFDIDVDRIKAELRKNDFESRE